MNGLTLLEFRSSFDLSDLVVGRPTTKVKNLLFIPDLGNSIEFEKPSSYHVQYSRRRGNYEICEAFTLLFMFLSFKSPIN